eukprot:6490779-Amphidinium_carterae.5
MRMTLAQKWIRLERCSRDKVGVPDELLWTEVKFGLELSRPYVAVSEIQIKKATSTYRLPKMSFKNIPCVRAPSEDGNSMGENIYLFKEKDSGVRKAELKMWLGSDWIKMQMDKSNFLHPSQGSDSLQHHIKQDVADMGLTDILGKDSTLPTFDEFLQKLQATEEPVAPVSNVAAILGAVFSGPAASAAFANLDGSAKPSPAPKVASNKSLANSGGLLATFLRKTPSQVSLGATSVADEIDGDAQSVVKSLTFETCGIEAPSATSEAGDVAPGRPV